MKRSFAYIVAFIFFGFIIFCFAAEEAVTTTTYFPSPYGYYNQTRVNQLAVGIEYKDPTIVPLADGYFITKDSVGINVSDPKSHFELNNTTAATTNTCVRIAYGNTGITRCPVNYHIIWPEGTPALTQTGFIMCCLECDDTDKNGICG